MSKFDLIISRASFIEAVLRALIQGDVMRIRINASLYAPVLYGGKTPLLFTKKAVIKLTPKVFSTILTHHITLDGIFLRTTRYDLKTNTLFAYNNLHPNETSEKKTLELVKKKGWVPKK